MLRLGFTEKWCGLIMKCVSSISYSFLINREVVGNLIPTRGIRLSSILSQARNTGLLRGIKVARASPSVSHLFFADDSLIFCRATVDDCNNVKTSLRLYEKVLGQLINYTKSALSFSPNTSRHNVNLVKNIFGMPVVNRHDYYLGLPTITLWNKSMHVGGHVRNIGGVVQKISGSFIGKDGRNLCEHKSKGRCNPSFTWRGLLWGRDLLSQGTRWVVGNGERIKLYDDRWLPTPRSFEVVSLKNLHPDSYVSCLLDQHGQWDEALARSNFLQFEAKIILGLLRPARRIEDRLSWHSDKKKRTYSIRSAYYLSMDLKHMVPSSSIDWMKVLWKWLWAQQLPPKYYALSIPLCWYKAGLEEMLILGCSTCHQTGVQSLKVDRETRWKPPPPVASAVPVGRLQSVESVELYAIRKGARLATSCGLMDITVISDAKGAIDKINSLEIGLNEDGSLVQEIRDFFVSLKFMFSPRNTNKVAHCIAQFALSSPIPYEWRLSYDPTWLKEVVTAYLLSNSS
ncbi:uncharacterized protein LOC119996123 [Tripterygium wilfordii]|uniref:uncharacterized protein LOC119996123 n=1 Tax=Tripterygium wilfordii TaxID=458696 RepID=UPI0018F8032D|nr:uncharacterized protein LOC119996123 [Tripterygium wilfordii]